MSDLGLFDRKEDDDTGSLDLEQLRAALARTAAQSPPPVVSRRELRSQRQTAARRRMKKRRHTVLAVVVLILLAAALGGAYVVWRKRSNTVPDFTGNGTTEVIVHVQTGDGTTDIANTLAGAGVVESNTAFVNAAAGDDEIASIKPGFYKVRLHSSAVAAVNALNYPADHVGQLHLIPGRQLADVSAKKGGTVTPGYITTIAAAACVPLNGRSHCFTAADLWQVEETGDPTALGVVDWAIPGVDAAPVAAKRLEGMILPGDYDVPPDSTPAQVLQAVVSASAANWNSSPIIAQAKALGQKPYQLAVEASLIEREAITSDMPAVAEVIVNRLRAKMKLQFDSTVNYALDRAQISTSAADRENPSPYNTYAHFGLPPTPISSPGTDAVAAALNPPTGTLEYFVKVNRQGDSCFSSTLAEHDLCVKKARANGVFTG